MNSIVKLYSTQSGEILRFLANFKNDYIKNLTDDFLWQKEYEDPIEIADIIGAFVENKDDYKINMWISLDKDLLINITKNNANEVIRYLYERYPY